LLAAGCASATLIYEIKCNNHHCLKLNFRHLTA
jgi:hypothetical protein